MDSAHIERAVMQACMRLLALLFARLLLCGSRRRYGAAACADIRMLRLRSAQRCMALRRASNCGSAISCASGHTSRARLSFGSGCMRRMPRRARSSACCARPSSRSTMNGCGRGNHAAAACQAKPRVPPPARSPAWVAGEPGWLEPRRTAWLGRTMQLREAVGRAEMAGFSSDALDVASAIIDEIAASEEALRAAIGNTDASPADTEQDHKRGTGALEAALARARDLRIVSGECHRHSSALCSIVRPTGLRRRPGL